MRGSRIAAAERALRGWAAGSGRPAGPVVPARFRPATGERTRVLRSVVTVIVVALFAGTDAVQPRLVPARRAPATAGDTFRPADYRASDFLPRPVGLLPDSDYPIPDGALFVATSGNDGWPGTLDFPLRTLRRAIDVAEANGTIVMRAGSYRESVGLVHKPVVIQPFPHEQVWMKGSDVQSAWDESGSLWQARGWTSPFCHTCFPPEAIDASRPYAGLPEQVFINGLALRQVGSRDEMSSGRFYVDPLTRALYIADDPAGARVEISSRWLAIQLDPRAAGSVIRGIGFRDYAPHWNEDQLGAVIVNAAFARLEGNSIINNSGTGLAVMHQPRVEIVGNVVSYNGHRGMVMFRTDHSAVRRNRFEHNNMERFNIGSCGGACTVAGLKAVEVAGLVIDNNDFTDNFGTGVWCDLACTDALFVANIVSGNASSGIFYEISGGGVIAGNFITHNATNRGSTTAAGVKVSNSTDTAIYHNVFVGNVRQIGVYDDDRTPEAPAHPPSLELGLDWDTARTTISANTFIPDAETDRLLNTIATEEVSAPEMFARTEGNVVLEPDGQLFYWELGPGHGESYRGLSAFERATGRDFGS